MRNALKTASLAIACFVYSTLPANAQSLPGVCQMDMSFDTLQAVSEWASVNDSVMGGLSSGGPRFEAGHMVFEGVINTNGGGFSSIRREVERGELDAIDALTLRVKSDGRAYRLRFRTDARYRGRAISFQADIPQTPIGEWAEVTVPLEGLRASLFGRPIANARFDKSKVWEMGFIIADGQDGPFRLDVDWIKNCA